MHKLHKLYKLMKHFWVCKTINGGFDENLQPALIETILNLAAKPSRQSISSDIMSSEPSVVKEISKTLELNDLHDYVDLQENDLRLIKLLKMEIESLWLVVRTCCY